MITLGYIGNGKSTNRYHIPFVETLKDIFTIKTVYARTNKSNWNLPSGAQLIHDLNALLNDPKIDAIVVCSPSLTHFEYAKKVLQSGKHCLVEKPFTTTKQEAIELFELAESMNLVIMPYQNRRYDSDLLTLKQLLKSNSLGIPYEINLNFDTDRTEISQEVTHGNVENSYLYGIGSHSLDQALYSFGIPTDYTSKALSILGQGRLNDAYDIQLNYDNLQVNVSGSMHRIESRSAIVAYGTQGIFTKVTRDAQERYLKEFILPYHPQFGIEDENDYGRLQTRQDTTYIPTVQSSYASMYLYFYNVIRGIESFDKNIILCQLEIIESTYNSLMKKPSQE